jgi:hypothetical protein
MRELYCLYLLIITTSNNDIVRFLDLYIFNYYNKLIVYYCYIDHCCQKYLQNCKEAAEGKRAVLFETDGRDVLIDKAIPTKRFALAR